MTDELALLHVRVTVDEETHRPLDCVVERDGEVLGRLPLVDVGFSSSCVSGTGRWTLGMHGIHVDFDKRPRS